MKPKAHVCMWRLVLVLFVVMVFGYWTWFFATNQPVYADQPAKSTASITLHFSCYVVTTDNEWIQMEITDCAPKNGAIVLDASVRFQKEVTLRETIIKDSYGVYEEVFDLEAMFGDDAIMAGHKFKKGQTYGFGAQLGLYKRQDTVVSVK